MPIRILVGAKARVGLPEGEHTVEVLNKRMKIARRKGNLEVLGDGTEAPSPAVEEVTGPSMTELLLQGLNEEIEDDITIDDNGQLLIDGEESGLDIEFDTDLDPEAAVKEAVERYVDNLTENDAVGGENTTVHSPEVVEMTTPPQEGEQLPPVAGGEQVPPAISHVTAGEQPPVAAPVVEEMPDYVNMSYNEIRHVAKEKELKMSITKRSHADYVKALTNKWKKEHPSQ